MMHHFRNGASETGLVIWSYSRFARDIDDSQFFRADLRRRGYVLYSLNDDIPDGPMGRLFEAAIDWKNEQFLEDLSRDVKRGLYDLVRTHGAVPGTPPVGFVRQAIELGVRRDGRPRVGNRWVIDDGLAGKVQKAFAMRAAGMAVAKIHAELHLYGSLNSYTTFFSNELYIGRLRFGEMVVDDYCPALIDGETWQAVQSLVKAHAAHQNNHGQGHPRRLGSAYLLSGLAQCGRCGAPLYGLSSVQRGSEYDRYACTRAKRRRDCDFPPVPRRALEGAVLGQLGEYILTPEVQRAHLVEMVRSDGAQIEQIEALRAECMGELGTLRRKIGNLTDALADAGKSRALLDKLARLEADEAVLLSRLAGIERDLRTPAAVLNEDEMMRSIERAQATLGSGDQTQIQTLLRGFVAKIVVDRDGENIVGVIDYYLLSETNKDPPGENSVFLCGGPLGASNRRYSFETSFTGKVRKYKKRS
jgi:hypothetical protein